MLKLDRPSRLGRASLETLAIVAYRQPITKSEIEEIRGVDVSANIKTLMDLQLIRLVGKSELPGHPFLYGTTPLFLEHFGLASLQQLNEIDPTLQRSNPRTKAAQYKKPVTEKTDLEKAAEEAEAEAAKETAEEIVDEKDVPAVEQTELAVDDEAVSDDDLLDDDDDIFIDDTPDEFDDDDDDDDDDEEEEDDDEK
jgi:segregation and condensation protein B